MTTCFFLFFQLIEKTLINSALATSQAKALKRENAADQTEMLHFTLKNFIYNFSAVSFE